MLGKNPVYISRRTRLLRRPDLLEEYRAGRLTLLQAAAQAEPIAGEDEAEADSPRITPSEESASTEAAGSGEEGQYELIERADLPGFIVARPGAPAGDGPQESDSPRITSAGSAAGRRQLFRWRPVQQFYNWVGRTHVADVPSDERATLKAQLTEIKEALEKQITELEQLEGGAAVPANTAGDMVGQATAEQPLTDEQPEGAS
jgi:hypothetical protein